VTHNIRLKSGQTGFLSDRSEVKNKSKIRKKGGFLTVPTTLPDLNSLVKGLGAGESK
jgi:hypothetical protein